MPSNVRRERSTHRPSHGSRRTDPQVTESVWRSHPADAGSGSELRRRLVSDRFSPLAPGRRAHTVISRGQAPVRRHRRLDRSTLGRLRDRTAPRASVLVELARWLVGLRRPGPGTAGGSATIPTHADPLAHRKESGELRCALVGPSRDLGVRGQSPYRRQRRHRQRRRLRVRRLWPRWLRRLSFGHLERTRRQGPTLAVRQRLLP